MGEIADLMINGDICEGCGCELEGGGDGFPRRCHGCGGDAGDFDPGFSRPKKAHAQPLSLKQIEKLSWCNVSSAMYEGCNWEDAPGQFAKLERMGLIECRQPHNRAHAAKAVLTDAGREVLARAKSCNH